MTSTSVPHFELARVYDDGSSESPYIVPLGSSESFSTDRRGFLRTGMTFGGVLRAVSVAPVGLMTPQIVSSQSSVTLLAHNGPVRSVCFSAGGKLLLASGGNENAIKL